MSTTIVTTKGLGDQQFAPDPQRLLRRADNLSTPTGQLAFKESTSSRPIIDEDAPLVETPTQLKGFRASIHKTWQKLVRSKSLGLNGSSGKKVSANGIGKPGPLRSFSTSVVSSSLSRTVNGSNSNGTTKHSRRGASGPAPVKEAPLAVDENEESVVDAPVPLLLVEGTPMTKVASKKPEEGGVLRVDPELGHLIWHRKKRRIIPLECINELRTGTGARHHREHFEQPVHLEARWITIVYMDEGKHTFLHLVAPTTQIFNAWRSTLHKLHTVRKELMSGLGNAETREAIWRKLYWKAADEERDERLVFEEVKKLCRRLCINLGTEELHRLFKAANGGHKDFLDFQDFEKFGKLLKYRPEIDRLYKKLKGKGNGTLTFHVFEQFMREKQKSNLSQDELRVIFDKYSVTIADNSSPIEKHHHHHHYHHHHHPPHERKMTYGTFQTFLMSPENSAFVDQHRHVWQDMTRPLSDYYISSSHNTYLVGHQLIGDSTIEGYIRALLHSCRSVEVDIYADPPSDPEPMVTHGGTLTSKVPLRAICQAIVQYGFVMSPYPIIISAEMHATVAGQEAVAKILVEVFGDKLIRRRMDGERSEGEGEGEELPEIIEKLPSPEALKGKILFKTKNLNLIHHKGDESALSLSPSLGTSSYSDDSEAVLSDFPELIAVDSKGNPKVTPKSARRKSGGEAVAAFGKDVMKAGSSLVHRIGSIGHGNGARHHRSASHSVESSAKPVISRPRASLSLPRPDLLNQVSEHGETNRVGRAGALYRPEQPTNSISNVISPGGSTPPPETANGQSPTIVRRLSRAVRSASPTRSLSSPDTATTPKKPKIKTAPKLAACLVYTVGVKCRGINKKEIYAPEHMFSLSESAANKMIEIRPSGGSVSGSAESVATGELSRRSSNHSGSSSHSGMKDLIKHCRTHLVRIYPKGIRFNSSNYAPHRFWCAGAQLVAINWQTKDLGYMINYAMFQRNGRSGYVLKPKALQGTRTTDHDATPVALKKKMSVKRLLNKRTRHVLEITIISAQQLPRPKDSNGIEIADGAIDPFVEVTVHAPDWPMTKQYSHLSASGPHKGRDGSLAPPSMAYTNSAASGSSTGSKPVLYRTGIVKKNGFNPVWEETLRIPFECVGDMQDLIFVRFAVGQGEYKDEIDPLAVYCTSLGSLGHGYRHIPLHDTQLSQYLFSTLFVKISIEDL